MALWAFSIRASQPATAARPSGEPIQSSDSFCSGVSVRRRAPARAASSIWARVMGLTLPQTVSSRPRSTGRYRISPPRSISSGSMAAMPAHPASTRWAPACFRAAAAARRSWAVAAS